MAQSEIAMETQAEPGFEASEVCRKTLLLLGHGIASRLLPSAKSYYFGENTTGFPLSSCHVS